MGIDRDVLVAEEDHLMVEQRLVDFGEGRLRNIGEVDARDLSTQGAGNRFDLDRCM